MPRYEITSPDGKRFEITAPEGASQEQVLEYAKQQFAGMEAPKRDIAAEIANDPISRGAREYLDPRAAALRGAKLPMEGKGPGELMSEGANWLGGKVTDFMANRGASPEAAAGAGTVANVAANAIPMVAGGEVAKLAAPVFDWAGKRLMQNALAPTGKDLVLGKADRAVQTMLDEGVNVSRGGMDKLRQRGEELNARAQLLLNNSPAQVNKYAVESRLRGPEQTFGLQANPQSDLLAIEEASRQFLSHPRLTGQNTMPVQLAQQLKTGTYKQLRDKYGEMGTASTEAQKALARGLKEEIEGVVPGVAPINAKAAEIWNAMNVAERRALMAANMNPLGIGIIASNPKAAATYAMGRSPVIKSALARMLYSGQEQIPANIARMGIGAATVNEDQ